jgi:triacylglycerol esterase/lipase EstA (alpha/beta hydrolase family)
MIRQPGGTPMSVDARQKASPPGLTRGEAARSTHCREANKENTMNSPKAQSRLAALLGVISLTTQIPAANQRLSCTTVFLVHGIGQTSTDVQPFKDTLQTAINLLAPAGRSYTINATFSYGCAANNPCEPSCKIDDAANVLASTINSVPGNAGHVIVIGYSMGGLIARDLILDDYGNAAYSHRITGLVTIGTPNLGYPYAPADDSFVSPLFTSNCPHLTDEMGSNFRQNQQGQDLQPTARSPPTRFPGTHTHTPY